MQVTRRESGEKSVDKKTNVKINLLKPKTAGEFPNIIPDIPTVSQTSELDYTVNEEKQDISNLVGKDLKKGFSFDLDMSTSADCDEYGVIVKYSSFYTKQDNKQLTLSATPLVGVYDYHPSSNEGLKVRAGVQGDLDITTDNNLNIHSTAIVHNNRIMQCGSSPINTFMTTFDTSVSKNNLSASVSAGYINSSSLAKYSFVTGSLEYKIKKSSVSISAGYQNYEIIDDKDKIFHIGTRYAVNF